MEFAYLFVPKWKSMATRNGMCYVPWVIYYAYTHIYEYTELWVTQEWAHIVSQTQQRIIFTVLLGQITLDMLDSAARGDSESVSSSKLELNKKFIFWAVNSSRRRRSINFNIVTGERRISNRIHSRRYLHQFKFFCKNFANTWNGKQHQYMCREREREGTEKTDAYCISFEMYARTTSLWCDVMHFSNYFWCEARSFPRVFCEKVSYERIQGVTDDIYTYFSTRNSEDPNTDEKDFVSNLTEKLPQVLNTEALNSTISLFTFYRLS